MTYIIGLTGGIGSGKTVVSDYFMQLGVPIIDTDVIARQIVEPGQPALEQLTTCFGDTILQTDGTLDRDALRTIAFSSPENKAQLDAITHPAIQAQTIKSINEVRYPYCLIVVPLLTKESVFNQVMQRIVVVTANTQTKVERIKQRSGLNEDEIERIMHSQLDDSQRLEFADDIIENNSSIAAVQAQADVLHKQYLALAEKHS